MPPSMIMNVVCVCAPMHAQSDTQFLTHIVESYPLPPPAQPCITISFCFPLLLAFEIDDLNFLTVYLECSKDCVSYTDLTATSSVNPQKKDGKKKEENSVNVQRIESCYPCLISCVIM